MRVGRGVADVECDGERKKEKKEKRKSKELKITQRRRVRRAEKRGFNTEVTEVGTQSSQRRGEKSGAGNRNPRTQLGVTVPQDGDHTCPLR